MSEGKGVAVFIGDLPVNDGTGRTIRERNADIPHNIPIDALVEVKYDKWHGGGACEKIHARLWVVEHGRDCDGTPLYCLARYSLESIQRMVEDICNDVTGERIPIRGDETDDRRFWHIALTLGIDRSSGFGEEGLTSIEVTDDLEKGVGILKWDENE